MSTSKRVLTAQTSMTATLASLANAAGRISTQVSFADLSTTFKAPLAVMVQFHFRTGASAPTLGTTVQFYVVRGAGSHVDANLATSDTGYTSASSPFTASQIRDQLTLAYSQPVLASTATDYYGSFLVVDPGAKFAIYVFNDTGQALDSTAGNFYLKYEEISLDLS